MKDYIDTMNSTNHTIAVGLALSVFLVVSAVVADLIGHPIGEHTLDTIGLFVLGLAGVGGAQFGMKRFTDTSLAQAKASAAAPVNVTMPPTQTNVINQQQPATGERGS